jgi:hypothetical protein
MRKRCVARLLRGAVGVPSAPRLGKSARSGSGLHSAVYFALAADDETRPDEPHHLGAARSAAATQLWAMVLSDRSLVHNLDVNEAYSIQSNR